MGAGEGQLVRRRRPGPLVLVPPAIDEKTRRDIECPARLGVHLRLILRHSNVSRADLKRRPGGQIVDPRDVAGLHVPAQVPFDAIDHIERGLRRLPGVHRSSYWMIVSNVVAIARCEKR